MAAESGEDIGAKVTALMAKRSRAQADLARLAESGETQLSLTDPDARLLVKSGQGIAGYNVQAAVDDKHNLIVASEVVNDSSDVGQLHAMAKAAKDTLEAETLQVLADEGYYSSLELKACEDDGITAYVPVPEGRGQSRQRGPLQPQGLQLRSCSRCLPLSGRRTAASDQGALAEHKWPDRDPLCESQGDLQACPLRTRCLSPKARYTDHRSLGT